MDSLVWFSVLVVVLALGKRTVMKMKIAILLLISFSDSL